MLLFWLNSLDIPSCLLVSSLEDLSDGVVFRDMTAQVTNSFHDEGLQNGISTVSPGLTVKYRKLRIDF